MKKLILTMCVAALCSTYALADLPQLRSEIPQFVLPKKIARISADLKIIGPWIDYQGGISGTACGTTISYDSFEPDVDDVDADGSTNDPQDGYYGLDCGVGGGRWLLVTYCDPFQVDDMGVPADQAGVLTDRVQWLWRWNPLLIDINMPSESCLIIIFTTEDVSLDCTAPSASNTFPGVIYNFGDLPDGFWYTDVDLCVAGLDHEMPSLGNNTTGCPDADATILGGNIMIGASEVIGTTIILALCEQPGLWGTKNSCNLLPGTGPYYQGEVHWDDVAPEDGAHDPAECFSYALGVCPDPLGWAVVFYSPGPTCAGFLCGDTNCDGVFDGADIDPFFLSLGDPIAWQIMFPLCDRICVTDINGDEAVDGADIDAFFTALGGPGCP